MTFVKEFCKAAEEHGWLAMVNNVVSADDWKYLEGIRYAQRDEAMSALVRAVKKIFTAWQKGIEPYETYAQAMRKDDRQ